MKTAQPIAALAALLALGALAGAPALAQSRVAAASAASEGASETASGTASRAVPRVHPACGRYRAELAGLGRAGAGGSRAEALQLRAYYRGAGCEGGGFLFFDTRPAQCAPIAQRIQALDAMAASGAGDEHRRRELRGLIAARCAPGAEAAGRDARGDGRGDARGDATARGGAQVICVRTCDGGFFPMSNLPEGRERADALCQALCPGTEAVAYSMPSGDDALRQAAAIRTRRAYASLPNAFRFRTGLAPNCACRREGQDWARALAPAEALLDRHPGDIVVTAARAEQMSRPRVAAPATPRPGRVSVSLGARDLGAPAGPSAPAAGPDASIPVPEVAPVPRAPRGTQIPAEADASGIRIIAITGAGRP